MKICYIVDARSAIAQNWIRYFIEKNHDVYIISSYPCSPDVLPGAKFIEVPIGGNTRVKILSRQSQQKRKSLLKFLALKLKGRGITVLLIQIIRWMLPFFIVYQTPKIRKIIKEIRPDIVHAMRVPLEGIFASYALTHSNIPLIVSIWGNDFTFHANNSFMMSFLTKKTMRRANAVHPDCHRDIPLARKFGFRVKMKIVLPGNGGIRLKQFFPGPCNKNLKEELGIGKDARVIINPRGFRPGSICSEIFFQSIPSVLKHHPDVVFLALAAKGNGIAEKWKKKFGKNLYLLPKIPHSRMADFFRLAEITVSPSMHDGTPNSLLEAMACGAFPIAGNIASIREWICDGKNGLLIDPTSSESLARAIIKVLTNEIFSKKAIEHNLSLIKERADYNKVMPKAEQFYNDLSM